MRMAHVNHLKSLLHLPLFLQRTENDAHEYGRKACVSSSRRLLEAYLQVHAGSLFPNGVTANLESFAAFTSATVLFLNLLGNQQQETSNQGLALHDGQLIRRVMAAIEQCSAPPSAVLCRQCHASLKTLVASGREMARGDVRNVVLPSVSISRSEQYGGLNGTVTDHQGNNGSPSGGAECIGLEQGTHDSLMEDSVFGPLDNMSLTCYEPWSLGYPASLFYQSGLEGLCSTKEGRMCMKRVSGLVGTIVPFIFKMEEVGK